MKKLLTNPFNIICIIIASILFGCNIYMYYRITKITNEEKPPPVNHDRFAYFPWYAGKGLTPDPTNKEVLSYGSTNDFLKDCSRGCSVSYKYIPAGTTKLVYNRDKKLSALLNVKPEKLKETLDGYYIYNPL